MDTRGYNTPSYLAPGSYGDPYNPNAFQSPAGQPSQAQGPATGGGTPPLTPGGPANFDFLGSQPGDALMRAMMNMGLNPASNDPVTKSILRNAENLYNTAIARGLSTGDLGRAGVQADGRPGDPSGLMNVMQQLVKGFAQNQPVFSGYTGALQKMNELAMGNRDKSNTSVEAQLLDAYLSNTGNAANMANALMYAQAPRSIGSVLSTSLAQLPMMYNQGVEQGLYGPEGSQGNITALALLNKLRSGMGSMPAGTGQGY